MTCIVEILKIKLEEKLLMKFCVIKHLILLKIQNMMDIYVDVLQWFINFLIKKTSGGAIKNKIMSDKELAEELQKPIIRKFKKEKYPHLL